VSILIDPSGKPRLAASELQFNVAHSGNLALVAVTRDCEIGVDLELLRPVDRSLEIATRNFHPHELAAIHATSENALHKTFLRCWTRKEAALKAIGTGLGYPLDAFDVLSQSSEEAAIELPSHGNHSARRCRLHDLRPSNEYCAAVASTAPKSVIGTFRFSI
jgi:4'-phosphopantetheinyl transferase